MSKYDERHGGPYDRGSADSYYMRHPQPHYFIEGTNTSPIVEADQMTKEQIEAYWAGYNDNEASGYFKEY